MRGSWKTDHTATTLVPTNHRTTPTGPARDPPSRSGATSSPPRRSAAPAPSPHQHAAALLALDDLVLRRGPQALQLEAGQNEAAARAAAPVEVGDGDAAELRPQPLVAAHEGRRDCRGRRGPLGLDASELLVDRRLDPGQGRAGGAQRRLQLGPLGFED